MLNIKKNRQPELPQDLKNVELINDYFTSVFNDADCTELVEHYQLITDNSNNNDRFKFSLASVQDVTAAIDSIKSNAFGSDGITLTMIRYCSPFIVPYITHLINVCLETSYFPNTWKTSHVQPIPKVNVPETFSDLRPISLLPVLSKIMERIIYKQMLIYVNTQNLLPEKQTWLQHIGCAQSYN